MTKATDQTIYRPNRRSGIGVLFAGIVFFTWGLVHLTGMVVLMFGGYTVGEMTVWLLLMFSVFVLDGGLLVMAGYATLTTRVVMNNQRLAKSFRFAGLRGFSFCWEAVESWSVQVRDSESGRSRVAWFIIQGWRGPVGVWEDDACRPNFDQFLQDARVHVGAKEQKPATGLWG